MIGSGIILPNILEIVFIHSWESCSEPGSIKGYRGFWTHGSYIFTQTPGQSQIFSSQSTLSSHFCRRHADRKDPNSKSIVSRTVLIQCSFRHLTSELWGVDTAERHALHVLPSHIASKKRQRIQQIHLGEPTWSPWTTSTVCQLGNFPGFLPSGTLFHMESHHV